jgi:hypothetical protein
MEMEAGGWKIEKERMEKCPGGFWWKIVEEIEKGKNAEMWGKWLKVRRKEGMTNLRCPKVLLVMRLTEILHQQRDHKYQFQECAVFLPFSYSSFHNQTFFLLSDLLDSAFLVNHFAVLVDHSCCDREVSLEDEEEIEAMRKAVPRMKGWRQCRPRHPLR